MRRERGIALITVILIVALVATTAAYISMAQAIWIRQAQNLNDLSMAEAVTQGGLVFALYALDQDDDRSNDNLTEYWALPIAAPFESGAVAGRLVDAQGKFNLNNLAQPNLVQYQIDSGIFRRLLLSLDIDPQLMDALADWIDADSMARPNGAEDDYYLNQPGHYRAANQYLQSVDELRLIKGFGGVDNDTVRKLRPFVTALPISNASININTASATVIAAMFEPALSVEDAQRLLAKRDVEDGRKGTPFKNCQELQQLTPPNTRFAVERCDVKTSYFEAEAVAKFGHLQYPTLALIERGGGAPGAAQTSHVLWQRYNVVKELPLAKK